MGEIGRHGSRNGLRQFSLLLVLSLIVSDRMRYAALDIIRITSKEYGLLWLLLLLVIGVHSRCMRVELDRWRKSL